MAEKDKYLAIKIKGMEHWLWFEREKTTEKNNIFKGSAGWGNGGCYTNIEINAELIQGRIFSEDLMYS